MGKCTRQSLLQTLKVLTWKLSCLKRSYRWRGLYTCLLWESWRTYLFTKLKRVIKTASIKESFAWKFVVIISCLQVCVCGLSVKLGKVVFMWGIRIHNLTKLFVIWGGLRILASILSPFAGCVVKLSSACIGNIWTRQTNFSSAYIYITPQYNNCLKEAEIISCAFEVKKDITNNVVLVELCFFFASASRPFI